MSFNEFFDSIQRSFTQTQFICLNAAVNVLFSIANATIDQVCHAPCRSLNGCRFV